MFLRLAALALVSLITAAATTVSELAPDRTSFDPAEAREAVDRYAAALEEMYVYPEIGKAYASSLRAKLSAGGYSSFASAQDFAKTLARDLARINPDLHLNVVPASVAGSGVTSNDSYSGGTCPKAGQQLTHSMGKSGWLASGVAYVEVCGFQGGEDNLAQLREFLQKHSAAKTLIIDNRGNVGGGHQEMDLMFPHFYRLMTELLRFEVRSEVAEDEDNPLNQEPRMKRLTPARTTQYAYYVEPIPSLQTALDRARIYVLTSGVTASAGEAAAFALKQSGRATLVGEPTKGAGHLGPTLPLGKRYRGFVPIARIFDPRTGQGWERTGVKPQITVAAGAALQTAVADAGVGAGAAMTAWNKLASKQPSR
jgi:hypothetical protein